MDVLGPIFAIFGGLMFVLLAIGAASSILLSLGLYKMAVDRGLEYPFVAWIPLGQFYIMAELVGEITLSGNEIPYLKFVLPGTLVFAWLIPHIGFIGTLAFLALIVPTVWKLAEMYQGNPMATVICFLIVPVVGEYMIYALSKNEPIEIEESSFSLS